MELFHISLPSSSKKANLNTVPFSTPSKIYLPLSLKERSYILLSLIRLGSKSFKALLNKNLSFSVIIEIFPSIFSGTVREPMKYPLKSGEETSNPCGSLSIQSSKEFSSPSELNSLNLIVFSPMNNLYSLLTTSLSLSSKNANLTTSALLRPSNMYSSPTSRAIL